MNPKNKYPRIADDARAEDASDLAWSKSGIETTEAKKSYIEVGHEAIELYLQQNIDTDLINNSELPTPPKES